MSGQSLHPPLVSAPLLPPMAPPAGIRPSPATWIRKNLFSTPFSGVLTICFTVLAGMAFASVAEFCSLRRSLGRRTGRMPRQPRRRLLAVHRGEIRLSPVRGLPVVRALAGGPDAGNRRRADRLAAVETGAAAQRGGVAVLCCLSGRRLRAVARRRVAQSAGHRYRLVGRSAHHAAHVDRGHRLLAPDRCASRAWSTVGASPRQSSVRDLHRGRAGVCRSSRCCSWRIS